MVRHLVFTSSRATQLNHRRWTSLNQGFDNRGEQLRRIKKLKEEGLWRHLQPRLSRNPPKSSGQYRQASKRMASIPPPRPHRHRCQTADFHPLPSILRTLRQVMELEVMRREQDLRAGIDAMRLPSFSVEDKGIVALGCGLPVWSENLLLLMSWSLNLMVCSHLALRWNSC